MNSICNSCNFHNPPGMRFCGNCGTRLVNDPRSVGLYLEKSQPPIDDMGVLVGSDLKERFHQAGLESAGQRRNVTVLFADLCDYTGLAGSLDDEELYEVIQLYIRMLAEKVYQYEGMVDKITGDGLMALFGAPIAHENPAERAVRAAMDMQTGLQELNRGLENRLGERLEMHIGLNRGSVIVGGVGADLLLDYTAIGDTVNLARRLQEAADENSILVSESVYQSTEAYFDYRGIPGLNLKGYKNTQPAYQLLSSKSQPGLVRGIQGLRSPMVGRQSELDDLLSSLDDLIHNQRGQLVTLIGEAGIGKSRLTSEFKANIDTERMIVLEGQSLTYRKSVSYWIFLELLRDLLGVKADTSNREVQEKLLVKVNQSLGPDAREQLSILEHLLSLPPSDKELSERISYLDAEQLRKQTFIAVRNLLLAEARINPLILILEDLHWVDEVSLDLLAFILESIDDLPIMVLVISRPPLDSNYEQVCDQTRTRLGDRCRSIRLQNLSQEQSDQLLFGLLGKLEIPEDYHSQILSRSAGVPFYIEEILRMLIDQDKLVNTIDGWKFSADSETALDVPENLQDLILTRFDRLEPIQRAVLQTASVIGRQFNTLLLNKVLEIKEEQQLKLALSSLVEKAFILPTAEENKDEYLFRHVLTSDAVYRTLLRKERNRLHGIVAETLEQFYADRLESQVEVLAGHFLRSEFLDKALHYHIWGGNKSARDYANLQARKYFEEARDLLPQVPHSAEQAMEVWTGLGDVLVFIGEYDLARDCYLELLDINLDPISSIEGQGHDITHRKIAITYERQGEFDLALEQLNLASEILVSGDIQPPVAAAQISNDTGWIYFLRGNFEEAQTALQSALELVRGSDQFGVVASIYNRLGAVAYQLRDYQQAAEYVRNSLELRKRLGDISGEARLYNNLGLLGLMSGDLFEAETNFNHSIQLLEKVGDTEGITLANINLGLVKFDQGDYDSAGAHLETARVMAENIGHRFYLALANMYLGRLETAQGGFDLAGAFLDESIEIFTELGAQDNLVDAMCYQAENYLNRGELGNSIEWNDKAHNGLKENLAQDSVQAGRVLRLQGAIARQKGDLGQAQHALLESAQIFRASSEKLESARTAYELGLLAQDLKDDVQAEKYFMVASGIFTEVGAKKEIHRVEAAMVIITA